MLKAYSGSKTREHFGGRGRPHELSTYGTDTSGTKSYRFNSLGFRGEEHDPDAAVTIFVCGCSNTFGTGLNLEETWVHQFKIGYAAKRGLDPADVNVLNFSHGGASNDYITRTLLTQCAQIRPDLVIAQFAAMYRAEGFVDGQPYCIGFGHSPRLGGYGRLLGVPWGMKWTVVRRMWQATGHLRRYSSEGGFADTMRNLLLLQFYCRDAGIPCVLTWSGHGNVRDPKYCDNPTLAPLIGLLDSACFCDFAIRDPEILIDHAADDDHPGPATNALFAARLLEFHQHATSLSS